MPFNKDINRFADKSNILFNMAYSSLWLLIDSVGNLYDILHYKSNSLIAVLSSTLFFKMIYFVSKLSYRL